MKIFILLTFPFLFSVVNGQNSSNRFDKLDYNNEMLYKTIELKNDYKLIYTTNKNDRNLWLIGHGKDTVIWSNSIDLEEQYMGWIEADFDKYFVLYSSGGGVSYMNLIDKSQGVNLADGIGIDIDTIHGIICYDDSKVENKLTFFDLKTSTKKSFELPDYISCTQWQNCIKIIDVTYKEISIEYIGHNNKKKIKKYAR